MSDLGREFDAYQAFLLGAKVYWTRELYPALRDRYETAAARKKPEMSTADDIEAWLDGDLDYAFFGWFERHLQRMKYSGRLGLVPAHEPHRDRLENMLSTTVPEGLLTLDPDFAPPRYFTSVDIHQHPGGVCGDPLAGVVYERGARTTTPLLSKHLDLHHRFLDVLCAERMPERIADLGCGFGKSTQPLYTELRDASVVGIDVSEPCLRLAAAEAAKGQAANVRYRQAMAEDTGEPGEAFDLVTSTMLLHEMPPPAIEGLIAESFRLLEPGGYAIHLDFLADDDPFNRFIHYGHSRRNNEPYMPPLNEMDLVEAHERQGFKDVRVIPFEESPGARSPENRGWRFPWAVVIAQK